MGNCSWRIKIFLELSNVVKRLSIVLSLSALSQTVTPFRVHGPYSVCTNRLLMKLPTTDLLFLTGGLYVRLCRCSSLCTPNRFRFYIRFSRGTGSALAIRAHTKAWASRGVFGATE